MAGQSWAGLISDQYFPEAYFWVDREPVDDTYTIREKHQYFTEAGKERFEDWFGQCAEGKCRLMAHIKNPDRYWYFLSKEEWEDEIDVTSEIRGMNLEPRTLKKIDYEVRINTEDKAIEVTEVDKGEYDPIAELEKGDRKNIPTAQAVTTAVAVLVFAGAVTLAVIFSRERQ